MSLRTSIPLFLACALLAAWPARAVDLKNRSTSRSGQFIVYCDDRELRSRVVSFVEEMKTDTLRVLREHDSWSPQRALIIVTMERAEPGKPVPPVFTQWLNTIAGPKIDVVVRVGDDPSAVFLQRHIVRAILLELQYREQPPKAAEPVVLPPWWLAEGIVEIIRRRDFGGEEDVFKSIVNTAKLPPIEQFIRQQPAHLDSAAGKVDRACALCLVEALLAQEKGSRNTMDFLRAWPRAGDDPMGALTSHFPALGGAQSLAKWWTLQLARFSSGDQLQGLTLADSDRELTALLTFEIPADKTGPARKFALADFARYVKLPAARNALRAVQVKIVTLSTKANPVLRPVLLEYEQLSGLLSNGKTTRVAERIAAIEDYRKTVVGRVGAITDYLNWYEATQPAGRDSDSFGDYLKRANKLEQLPPVNPRIAEYLDGLEKDFAPLTPNAIPGAMPDSAASR